jgi:hypothetical protein
MPDYCLEAPATSSDVAILHKQCCPQLDLASLLATGRLSNLGCYADAPAAAKSLKPQLPYVCCGHCCDFVEPFMGKTMHKTPSFNFTFRL